MAASGYALSHRGRQACFDAALRGPSTCVTCLGRGPPWPLAETTASLELCVNLALDFPLQAVTHTERHTKSPRQITRGRRPTTVLWYSMHHTPKGLETDCLISICAAGRPSLPVWPCRKFFLPVLLRTACAADDITAQPQAGNPQCHCPPSAPGDCFRAGEMPCRGPCGCSHHTTTGTHLRQHLPPTAQSPPPATPANDVRFVTGHPPRVHPAYSILPSPAQQVPFSVQD